MPQFQMIPAAPGFSSQLAAGLGGGVGQGLSAVFQQHLERKRTQAQYKGLLDMLGMGSAPAQGGSQSAALESLSEPAPSPSASLGQTGGMQIRPEQVLAASLVNPQLGSALSNIYQGQQREKTGTEKEFLKSNLESFKESQQKLPEIRNTSLRLNRLDELSKSGELPGPLLAKLNISEGGKVTFPAAFSKEGQEFVKLVVDSAKGAKDSFGSRISNFELDTFLQSLPSLLQTSEGRDAVIRDLKIMNDLNKIHNQAVIDISKQVGFKVDPAQFESLVQQRIGPQAEDLSKQFIKPESVAPSKGLSVEVMQDFLRKAPGTTKEEKIANAKKMARQKGYEVQ